MKTLFCLLQCTLLIMLLLVFLNSCYGIVIPWFVCLYEEIIQKWIISSTGSGCSKLTTSLVNVSLKFQMLISQIHWYFLLKKCKKLLQWASHIFSTKNISVFGYKVVKHLTSWPLNELVKLTMFWTTWPRWTNHGITILYHPYQCRPCSVWNILCWSLGFLKKLV